MSKRHTTKRPVQHDTTANANATAERETPARSMQGHKYYDLAADALLDGWTREQVIRALVIRVTRDASYLAFRKASNRRTGYDAQVQQDMRALSLAALWLEDMEDMEDMEGAASQSA